jgi:hypothetical protein
MFYDLFRKINSIIYQNDTKTLITGSSDGYIKLYEYKNHKTKRWLNITNLEISTMTGVNSNIIGVLFSITIDRKY